MRKSFGLITTAALLKVLLLLMLLTTVTEVALSAIIVNYVALSDFAPFLLTLLMYPPTVGYFDECDVSVGTDL